MRLLTEIIDEKEKVTANLKRAGLWCVCGLAITILFLIIATRIGFLIITIGAIGWSVWTVYKCLRRLDELKKEEAFYKAHSEDTFSAVPETKSCDKTDYEPIKKVTLRSKTFK